MARLSWSGRKLEKRSGYCYDKNIITTDNKNKRLSDERGDPRCTFVWQSLIFLNRSDGNIIEEYTINIIVCILLIWLSDLCSLEGFLLPLSRIEMSGSSVFCGTVRVPRHNPQAPAKLP